MEERTLKTLGVLGLIVSGGLALFLVLTQSTRIYSWDGDNNGNPTGQTIVISSSLFKTNKFHLIVSKIFIYSNQDHETGTFNLTRVGTGENFSVSYDIEPGVFQQYEFDGGILELPAGTYTITADNHHHNLTPCNDVDWQIIQAGFLRFSDNITGGIPESTEGWMYVLIGLGAFLLGLASVVGIIKGVKGGGTYSAGKDKPITLAGHQIKSFVESSPNYRPQSSAPSPSASYPAPVPVPKPRSGEASISSTELDLIAQAALKKAGPTKTCPSCGKVLPVNAKFCNGCGQQY